VNRQEFFVSTIKDRTSPKTKIIMINDQAGNIDDQAGNIDDQAGNIDDQVGNIDDQAGNIDDQANNDSNGIYNYFNQTNRFSRIGSSQDFNDFTLHRMKINCILYYKTKAKRL
jgi:hypothetical protein